MSRPKQYLDFADGIKLGLEASADTHVGYGVKGWGKTWLGMKLAECILDAGGQVISIDITGVWWGLTSSADGKSPGYPLYVFGGNKADLPLKPDAGRLIARALVESRASAVLDLSLTRKAEQHRFAADFLDELYQIKAEAAHRDYVCTVMLDEGNRFAPQKPGDNQARVLGAAEDIILQGRSRGLGMVTLTQRPAVLNKNISTQAGGLFLGRIVSPQDQKAVGEWLTIHASDEAADKIIGKPLATLPQGELFYISTSDAADPVRIKLRPRVTFDSSFTPRPGQRARVAKVRAKLDVGKLSAEIQATAAEAEANKPSTLKLKLAQATAEFEKLKAQLATPVTIKAPAPGKVTIKRVEVPSWNKTEQRTLNGLAELLKQRIEAINLLDDRLAELRADLTTDRNLTREHLDILAQLAGDFEVLARGPLVAEIAARTVGGRLPEHHSMGGGGPQVWSDSKTARPLEDIRKVIAESRNQHGPPPPFVPPAVERALAAQGEQGNGDSTALNAPMRKFLTALAQRGRLTKNKLLFFGKYASTGATSRAFASLIKLGLATQPAAHELEITPLGRERLGPVPALETGAELRRELLDEGTSRLTRPVRVFLAALVAAYPQAVSKAELLTQGGYASTGATSRAFAYLVKAGYATSPRAHHLRASDTLFDPHEVRPQAAA